MKTFLAHRRAFLHCFLIRKAQTSPWSNWKAGFFLPPCSGKNGKSPWWCVWFIVDLWSPDVLTVPHLCAQIVLEGKRPDMVSLISHLYFWCFMSSELLSLGSNGCLRLQVAVTGWNLSCGLSNSYVLIIEVLTILHYPAFHPCVLPWLVENNAILGRLAFCSKNQVRLVAYLNLPLWDAHDSFYK